MKYIRTIFALLFWLSISGAIWYFGYLTFENVVQRLQDKHDGVDLKGFPWDKAYTPEERWNLLRSFSFVRGSSYYDSLYLPLSQVYSFRNLDVDAVFLNLYDVFFLRSQSDTLGKTLFFEEFKRLNKFHLSTNSEIDSYIKQRLPQIVIIKDKELQQLLRTIWKTQNGRTITLIANILNTTYFLLVLIFLPLIMFGKTKFLSIIKFEEIRNEDR